MALFRKKPIVIEAVQYWPTGPLPPGVEIHPDHDRPFVQTLEGQMWVSAGDWIIKGVAGEYYPCKRAIFEATYERV